MEFTVSYNPTTKVLSPNFCCILCISSHSLGPMYPQEEGITQGSPEGGDQLVLFQRISSTEC